MPRPDGLQARHGPPGWRRRLGGAQPAGRGGMPGEAGCGRAAEARMHSGSVCNQRGRGGCPPSSTSLMVAPRASSASRSMSSRPSASGSVSGAALRSVAVGWVRALCAVARVLCCGCGWVGDQACWRACSLHSHCAPRMWQPSGPLAGRTRAVWLAGRRPPANPMSVTQPGQPPLRVGTASTPPSQPAAPGAACNGSQPAQSRRSGPSRNPGLYGCGGEVARAQLGREAEAAGRP